MVPTFSNPGTTVIKPIKLAHVVLKTAPAQFPSMVQYYKTFLSAHPTHENEYLSFLTYDDEHHRIAIAAMPSIQPRAPTAAGLMHIAFTFSSLRDLALAYRQRKAHGVVPFWCVNHGPTTSMYYRDPDGNEVECQVDNFERVEDSTAFMMTKAFEENPIGVDFDPEELIGRIEAGEDEAVIKKRIEIGKRGIPDFL